MILKIINIILMNEHKNVSEYYLNLKDKIYSFMNVGSILDKSEFDGHLLELGQKINLIFQKENAYTI